MSDAGFTDYAVVSVVVTSEYHSMYRSLSSFVPDAADILSLEVEELAGVLLMHLNSYEGVYGNSVYQNGLISQTNFFNAQSPTGTGQKTEYGEQQPKVNHALMEAWSWL